MSAQLWSKKSLSLSASGLFHQATRSIQLTSFKLRTPQPSFPGLPLSLHRNKNSFDTPPLPFIKQEDGGLADRNIPTTPVPLVRNRSSFDTPLLPFVKQEDGALNFDKPEIAFHSKNTFDLWRGLFVFSCCSNQWLVKHSLELLRLSYKFFGSYLTHRVIRHSFFAHFCAGETAKEVKGTFNRLASEAGIGGILDYAAESDVTEDSTEEMQQKAVGIDPNENFKALEPQHEANKEVLLQCISTAATQDDGFAAVKLTALIHPNLLQKLSKVLDDIHKMWQSTLREESLDEEKRLNFQEFTQMMKAIGQDLPPLDMQLFFLEFDKTRDGFIDAIEWTDRIDLHCLIQSSESLIAQTFKQAGIQLLSDADAELILAFEERIEEIGQAAVKKKVKLMVDAEYTYVQFAIDYFVRNLQKRYNMTSPVIFNTYQCYLKAAQKRVRMDLERAKRRNAWFACKLVRGAYLVQERERAEKFGYACPVFENIESTHKSYDTCLDLILENHARSNVMIASHNQASIQLATRLMDKYSIPINGGVYFGQLLGMADLLSFTLGECDYQVYKYLPYGPVNEVIPYLIRRAQENSDLLTTNVSREISSLWTELKRRKLFLPLNMCKTVEAQKGKLVKQIS